MKRIIYKYLSVLLVATVAVMSSCDPEGFEPNNNGKVSSIQIKEAVYVSDATRYMKISFKDNVELQLTPVILPQNAKNQKLTYVNLHPEIMEVTEAGLLKPKSIGIDTLIVSATDGSGVKTSYVVEVLDHIVKATGISVTSLGSNMEVEMGKTFNLKPEITVLPADVTDNSVTFESLDTSIATVDANGVITAVATGNTTIRVTTADGSNVTRDCNVTVLAEAPLYLEYLVNASGLSSNLGLKEGSLEALLDDNNATFWAPEIEVRPIYSPACWLDIDFGEAIKFAQLGYRHRALNYAHLQCHTFTLQGKKDAGDSWTDLGEFVTESMKVADYQIFEIGLEKVSEIRYLRINFIKGHLRDGKPDWNYTENGNVSVGDLKFYIYNR